MHNERVQYFLQQVSASLPFVPHGSLIARAIAQRVVPEARRVLIYLPDDTRPRLVLLGTGDDWDPNCGCPPYPEDLDVAQWFPENRAVSSLERFPGTQCHLGNGYDIISLRGSGVGRHAGHESHEWARANETLHRLFSIEWMGPLIAVKRARHHSGRAINITPAEVSLINAVVEGYVHTSGISETYG